MLIAGFELIAQENLYLQYVNIFYTLCIFFINISLKNLCRRNATKKIW